MNLEIFADRPEYMIYVVNSQASFQYYLTIPKSMSNGFNIILDFSKNDLAKSNKDDLVNNIEKVNKLIDNSNGRGIYLLSTLTINYLGDRQELVNAVNKIYQMLKEVISIIQNVTNNQATINPVISIISNNDADKKFIEWLKNNTNMRVNSIHLEELKKKNYEVNKLPLDLSSYKVINGGNKRYAFGPILKGDMVIVELDGNSSLEDIFEVADREFSYDREKIRSVYSDIDVLAKQNACILFSYIFKKYGGYALIDSEFIKNNLDRLSDEKKKMFADTVALYPRFKIDLNSGMFVPNGGDEVLRAKFNNSFDNLVVGADIRRDNNVNQNNAHSDKVIEQDKEIDKNKTKVKKLDDLDDNAGNIGLQAIAIIMVISLIVLFILI